MKLWQTVDGGKKNKSEDVEDVYEDADGHRDVLEVKVAQYKAQVEVRSGRGGKGSLPVWRRYPTKP